MLPSTYFPSTFTKNVTVTFGTVSILFIFDSLNQPIQKMNDHADCHDFALLAEIIVAGSTDDKHITPHEISEPDSNNSSDIDLPSVGSFLA